MRAKVFGTALRPRLSVFRSSKHLHIQLIDDTAGKTLAYASSQKLGKMKSEEKINQVAKHLVAKAAALGIREAVFDRGGFRYQGQIAKLAEAARAAGLKF